MRLNMIIRFLPGDVADGDIDKIALYHNFISCVVVVVVVVVVWDDEWDC